MPKFEIVRYNNNKNHRSLCITFPFFHSVMEQVLKRDSKHIILTLK